eukprot:687289-Prorocentrum_minimum.AAC.1
MQLQWYSLQLVILTMVHGGMRTPSCGAHSPSACRPCVAAQIPPVPPCQQGACQQGRSRSMGAASANVRPPPADARDDRPPAGHPPAGWPPVRGKCRSSVDAREPQNPTKGEEYQRHLQ